MITKVQLAAMSRADVEPSKRPACFLYVDEFQNFATESFATILSEARKYNLGLTVAHQYIAQMSPEVKDAVFGNVGSMISFRVGSEDAKALKPEFEPVFDENDLVNLQRGHVYTKLLIDGLAVPAFSARTAPPRPIETSYREEIMAYSRATYAHSREEAEEIIDETAGYRKRREAEEASKNAKAALEQGNEKIGIRAAGSPASAPRLAAQPTPAPATPRPVAASAPAVQPTPAPVSIPKPEPAPIVEVPPVVAEKPAPKEEAPAPKSQAATSVEAVSTLPPLPKPPTLLPEQRQVVVAEPVEAPAVIHEQKPNIVVVEEEEILPQTYGEPAEQGVEEPEERKERVEKPLKIMDKWVYKEVAQRGGLKWFLGEQEDKMNARLEEKRRLKEEQNLQAESPTIISPTEQRANEAEPQNEAQKPVEEPVQQAMATTSIPLEEGKSIAL